MALQYCLFCYLRGRRCFGPEVIENRMIFGGGALVTASDCFQLREEFYSGRVRSIGRARQVSGIWLCRLRFLLSDNRRVFFIRDDFEWDLERLRKMGRCGTNFICLMQLYCLY